MKTLKSLFVVVVSLVSTQSWAQEKVSVYFIRPSMAIGSAHNTFVDDKFAYRVKSGHYVITDLDPGERKFSSRLTGKKPNDDPKPVTVLLEPGKNHYFLLVDVSDGFVTRPRVLEVTENYARPLIEKMTGRKSTEFASK
jgi:hypothetical protein